ncbi:hypothetical protein PsorP6_009698 [Peronosclerospora sorghi]|uniref:Uncharacterized protein n=1 Tax=Peronosclerospora sorghi TaxID=230839 RepID=A0ACC0W219_9STRA|nr:hypothetical protein PsorP6_009698 [Peronosclerospora sorghi]
MGHSALTHATMFLHSQPNWDGKCHNCRRLMSSCICIQESESDADPLHTGSFHVIADASEARPLWNALRKMHRMSTAPCLSLAQLPLDTRLEPSELQRKHSEALPSCNVSTPLAHIARRHIHPSLDAGSPRRPRRGSRERGDEVSPERSSLSCRNKIQRAVLLCPSHSTERNVKVEGVIRSIRTTNSIGKHYSIGRTLSKEKPSYGPEADLKPSDEENKTVWEL